MTTILAFLIRFTLLAGLTYLFIVLYDHGPKGFIEGLGKQGPALAEFASTLGKAPPPPEPVPMTRVRANTDPPAPEAASEPQPDPSSTPATAPLGLEKWRKLQEKRIGEGSTIEDPIGIEKN